MNILYRAHAPVGDLSGDEETLYAQHKAVRFDQPDDVEDEYHEYVQQYARDLQAVRSS